MEYYRKEAEKMLKRLGKAIAVFVVGTLVANTVTDGLTNLSEGKTFFGKEKKHKKTEIDWKGNVHLGSSDYEVV